MKAAAALAILLAWPAAHGLDVALSSDEAVTCKLQGGCSFVTNDWLKTQLKAAHEAGKREGAEPCRRPMT